MLSFFLLVGVLVVVALVSWYRTAQLRHGAVTKARDPPDCASCSTSPATFLAATAGVAALAWGAVLAWGGQRTVGLLLAGVGSFVASAGAVARVAGFRLSTEGFAVLYARRPPFAACWDEIGALRPPRVPLGGWRVTDVRGGRSTLMPSDLLGHESILDLIVVRASLRFDGLAWSRDDPGHRAPAVVGSQIDLR
jgi:hypothetical protein